MPDALEEDLIAELRGQIEQEMEGLRITRFRAKRDRDHDGDPILRLEIVYDEAGGEPRAKRVSALARHLRPWLETRMPNTFPVFRFLTTRDLADDAR